jgi:heme exporter protein D
VTPKLPEATLVMVSRRLLWVIAIQVALFVLWVGIGLGPGSTGPFAALVGPYALFVWLRLVVGLVFPLVVSWAAVQTARTRSMESATGLLYINVGTIAAGTILAAGLYFGAGLLV